jgi:hypothetical protein
MPRNKSFAGANPHNNDWDDWGGNSAGGGGGNLASASSSGSAGGHGQGQQGQQRSGSEYTMSQLQASASDKDNFFNRKIAENDRRPEGLPPSQGAWRASGEGQAGGAEHVAAAAAAVSGAGCLSLYCRC